MARRLVGSLSGVGEVYAGDVLCAEAEGIFVSIARDRFEELESQRAAREAERAR